MTDLKTAIRQHESFEAAVQQSVTGSIELPRTLLDISQVLSTTPLTVHTEVARVAHERVVASDPMLLDTREGAL